jgi:hypothetical protein
LAFNVHIPIPTYTIVNEELDGPAVSALRVRSQKLSKVGQSLDGLPKIYYLKFLRASEGTITNIGQSLDG